MNQSVGLRSAVWLASVSVLLGACTPDQSAERPLASPEPSTSVSAPTVSTGSGVIERSPTASSTPKAPTKHRPYSDVNPPPRRGGDFVVKVIYVSRLDSDDPPRPEGPNRLGWHIWGEKVRTCVRRSSQHSHVVGWKDWRIEGAAGQVYPADPGDFTTRETPTYPFRQVLSPGECATGWWMLAYPPDALIDHIQFAPEDGPTLIEWGTMR